jgi:recombinase
MAEIERIREILTGPLDPEDVKRKTEAGWKLVGLEWERPAGGELAKRAALQEEIPYGCRVANDCLHLEEDAVEMRTLTRMLELIVQDRSMSRMAEELNRQGFRNRDGSRWNMITVYNMLPRLIEVGPRILSSEEWKERRKQILKSEM